MLLITLVFFAFLCYIDCMSNQERRSSRSDEGQETRQRIIDAAYQVLATKGYEATTLKEIAKAADAAPGLVHYYFGGKDQLLVEVLKAVGNRYTATTQHMMQHQSPEQIIEAALKQPMTRVTEEPEWYRLRYELFSLGLHNELIAPGIRELLSEGRQSLSQTVKALLGATTVEPTVIASLLLACFDGLALQKIMDADVDIDAAYAALLQMLLSLRTPHKG